MAESWWEREKWATDVVKYVVLIRAFLENRLSASEFQMLYFAIFKSDEKYRPREIFDILDTLFADIDEYCDDDELRRRTAGMDEVKLRMRARIAIDRLSTVATEHPSGFA